MTTHAQSDDFDIAKGIFDQLKDLPTERQQRVLRWIAEGLGVSPVPTPPAATHASGPAPSLPPVAPQLHAGAGSGPTDIKSFVAAKSPKSDQQFAAAVAYFYRFESPPAERRDAINSEVLQEAARLAGHKRFAKHLSTLNNAKAAGYLDAASRGEFTINSVGENLIAMTLPGGADTPTKKRKSAKARSKTKPMGKKR
jgi:hypothetical protein